MSTPGDAQIVWLLLRVERGVKRLDEHLLDLAARQALAGPRELREVEVIGVPAVFGGDFAFVDRGLNAAAGEF